MPPIVKSIKEKNPENVPLGMLGVLLAGLSLWIYYGCINKDWPIVITNCFSVMQNLTLMALRYKYKNNK